MGTVQFGLAYGVAGRGTVVPPDEVRAILEAAARGGIRVLDTAPAYGDVEARLQELGAGLGFSVVSKIGQVCESTAAAVAGIQLSIERSIERLGSSLTTLLFHSAADLLRCDGDALWRAAADAAGIRIRLGVSVYDPAMLVALRRRYRPSVAQCPANPFDQRLLADGMADAVDGVELHARSVFLQGLLLIPTAEAIRRVPASAAALRRWASWCAAERRTPLAAALAIVRGLPGIRCCVVGVDRASQLQAILDAAKTAPLRAPAELACDDPDVIDPRRWPAA